MVALPRTTFRQENILERQDLQKMLKRQIEIIALDTMIVAEEFSDWDGSRRSIDLLGIDRQANLVVIELKRSEHGDHMDLQSIRYAAMISTMTFDRLVSVYDRYIQSNELGIDAEESLLEFLNWSEPDEENFAQAVNIVLASAEFSKELTTSVAWLNDAYGMQIRCVRMQPYKNGEEVLLDVQTIIPLPEIAEYQIKISEKKQKQRADRDDSSRRQKFVVTIDNNAFQNLTKRAAMYHLVKSLLVSGENQKGRLETICSVLRNGFKVFDGELSSEQVLAEFQNDDRDTRFPPEDRYYTAESELFHIDGKTYVFTNQWGGEGFFNAFDAVKRKFPGVEIDIAKSPEN